jgi:hypothetical protein
MFAGGGLAWAERKLKQGGYTVVRAPMGVTADLIGLSCRCAPISTKHGVILSLIVVPRDDPTSFVELIQQLLRTLRSDEPNLHPLPAEGPLPAWTGDHLDHAIKKGSRNMPFAACTPFWRGWAPYWEFLLVAFMKFGSDESLWRIQITENSMTAYV